MPPKKATTKPATRANTTTKKATATATTTKKAVASITATRGRAATTAKDTAAKTTTKSLATRKAPKTEDAESKDAKAASAQASKKRRAEAADDTSRTIKRARVVKSVAAKQKQKVIITNAPTAKLNVYVCGEGSSGELGLGVGKNVIDVKRPRLNPHLLPDTVGVVQVAVGGMHCVALTHDNKILTWGVNDQGALGRSTTWDGGYKDMDNGDSDSDSDSDDGPDLNPYECTPTAISSSAFPEGTVFVEVAAGDSSSFALTNDGQVYGWGTFRSNDGILGFDASTKVQTIPTLLPALKKIKHLVCGDNHVLALNDKGAVFSWGSGQQNQLGRRIIERNKLNGLQPREFGLPKGIVHIGAGAFHSFAVHQSGRVYAWGLNSFGETGIREYAGDSDAAIVHPTVVDSLSKKNVSQICGGAHHSIAVTHDGQCLVWGRLDGYQTGLKIDTLSDDVVIKDERDRPRILIEPTAVPDIKAKTVAAGSDHSIAIDQDGRPWSWGFSATYQTGQGTQEDVEVATVIENTAIRGRSLNWAGGGGQFSVFTEPVTF
ncbi:regulator of chromosome condensation 1/beta-lactamase-inhibitor protein II [Aspergillus aurantiobrunneus]